MKVYKVVGPYEVEKFTMDGWALDKVLGHSYADKVQCQRPVATEAPQGCYGGVSQYPYEEVIQVHEPMFLLTKEIEVIQKEQLLTDEVGDLKKKLELKQKERDQWMATSERSQREMLSSEAAARVSREHWDEFATKAQKLERDLAKLRVALGDLRMKEILE